MQIVSKVTQNIPGALVGAGAGYLVAHKVIKSEKTWVKILSIALGAIAGAFAQSGINARKSVPTAATVKK